jgi:hypothetical protein
MHSIITSAFIFSILYLGVSAQSNSADCNTYCMWYRNDVLNVVGFDNANVHTHGGDISADDIEWLCKGSDPVDCCRCGGTGITGSVQMTVLTIWALVCETYDESSIQDALGCWENQDTCHVGGWTGSIGGEVTCLEAYEAGDFSSGSKRKSAINTTNVIINSPQPSTTASAITRTGTRSTPVGTISPQQTSMIAKSEGMSMFHLEENQWKLVIWAALVVILTGI